MTKPTTVHPMLVKQVRNARIKADQIEAVAYHLANLMEEAHGEKCRVQIDHQVGLIAIVTRIHEERPVDIGEDQPNGQP